MLFGRSGLLYGELARFVLRLLGIKTKSKNVQFPGMDGLPGPHNPHASQNYIEGPNAAPNSEWDGAWENATNPVCQGLLTSGKKSSEKGEDTRKWSRRRRRREKTISLNS